MLQNIGIGFSVAFTLTNVIAALIGTAAGIVIGALPGLTATMGVALLVPITFIMEPVTGLIMLSGIYCGAIYGGSITAILFRTPGTPAAIMTMFDGNIMTKRGEAKRALSTAILASFCGGLLSAFALLFFSPILAHFALRFGPPEYFSLALFGMTVICSLSAGTMLKGLTAGFFGVFIATIGMDPALGVPRYTFDMPDLLEGFSIIPLIIGLFSIPEALDLLITESSSEAITKQKGKLFFNYYEYFKRAAVFIKASIIGVIIGIIPAVGPVVAPFISYREAKRSSKYPEKFGTGIIDGIIASEAANNGVTGGSLVPLLTLGIPGSAVAAVYLGALTIHGLMPGPMLFQRNPDIVYGLFIGFFIVNFIMLGLGLSFSTLFAQVVLLPRNIVATFIIFFSIMGSLAMNGNIFDVWIMFAFGILGFLMRRYGFPAAPVVLGVILAPLLERNLMASLSMSGDNPFIFFTRPIYLIIICLSAISLIAPFWGTLKLRFR